MIISFSLFILFFALSIDTFVVSSTFACYKKNNSKVPSIFISSIIFAIGHIVLFLLGSFCASFFINYIASFSHIITFCLFSGLAIKMLYEFIHEMNAPYHEHNISFKTLLWIAFVVSVDALVAGFSVSINFGNVYIAAIILGSIVLAMSYLGYFVGSKIKLKFKNYTYLFASIILFFLAFKQII